jgi:hypothetical protein
MGFFGGGGGTTPVNMVGASTGTAGTAGYVPAPAAGKNTRALFSDATFAEVPVFPQYKNTGVGSYIAVWNPYNNAGGAYSGTRVRNFMPVYVPASGQIDKLTFLTAATGTPAVNMHIAMWECAEDGTPSTYVIGGIGSTGTAATTLIDVSVTATSVNRGFYYLSLTAETQTNVTIRTNAQPSYLKQFIGGSGLGPSENYTFYYTATTYNQTTHETFSVGSPANTMFPVMAFQYV